MTLTRKATAADSAYLAESCIQIVRYMRTGETDKFIADLPEEVTADTIKWAKSHTESKDKAAFVAMSPNGSLIGCIFGKIDASNLPMAVTGEVGEISVCWVEPDQRNSGVGRALLAEIERWFLARGIHHIEVAYMAKNQAASNAWTRLGFTPFRTFAFKEIGE